MLRFLRACKRAARVGRKDGFRREALASARSGAAGHLESGRLSGKTTVFRGGGLRRARTYEQAVGQWLRALYGALAAAVLRDAAAGAQHLSLSRRVRGEPV